MNKEQMIQLLRSVCVDENTVVAMSNAFDIGFEFGYASALEAHGVSLPVKSEHEKA